MRKLIVVSLVLLLCLTSVTFIKPSAARRQSRFSAARGEVIVKLKEAALPAASSATVETRAKAFNQRQGNVLALAERVGAAAGSLRARASHDTQLREGPAPTLEDGLELLAPEAINAGAGGKVGDLVGRYGFDRIVIMRFDPEADLEAIVAALRANEAVEYAEPNSPMEVGSVLPSDPRFVDQWALRNLGLSVGGYPATLDSDIKATQAWELTTGSPTVLVAVTDTGIDAAHPDLLPNLYTNPREIPGNDIDDDNNGYVDDVHGFNVASRNDDITDVTGHGTEMSGIIAAKMGNGIGISGVSQSKIVPVKFFKRVGPNPGDVVGTVAAGAKALLYAIAVGAHVINASWSQNDLGDEDMQTLRDAISATNDAGILLVCIAGNQGLNLDFANVYPAKFAIANQIVVAASEFNDDIWHPPFVPNVIKSGFGRNSVDIAAPGVTILTTAAHGDCLECSSSANPEEWYHAIDGTSAAAAYVSGVAALIKSRYPEANAAVIKRRLMESAEPRQQLQPYVRTGGRLNAYGALTIDLPATLPVLTRLKIKASGKTFIFGEKMQDGALLVIGGITYPAKFKGGDFSRLVTNLPLETLPTGQPFQVRLRNPDGGESLPITITR